MTGGTGANLVPLFSYLHILFCFLHIVFLFICSKIGWRLDFLHIIW